MSSRRVAKGSRDRISSLPDVVLGKILSHLPTKLAASTSVLSKRWKNLLVLVDSLDFSDLEGRREGFCDFVDKILALLSNSTNLKKFSLNCEHSHDTSRFDNWIRSVMERGFSELNLSSAISSHDINVDCFKSNTLVKLALADGFYPEDVISSSDVSFPALKTLSLASLVEAGVEAYGELISGCSLLEELFIHFGEDGNCWDNIIFPSIPVSNPSLKRLIISYEFPGHRRSPVSELFQTPSLVYLEFTSYVAEKYKVDFASLVEAKLDLRRDLGMNEDGDCDEDDDAEDEDDNDDASGEDDDDNHSGFPFDLNVNAEDYDYSGGGEKKDEDHAENNVFRQVRHNTEDDEDSDNADAYFKVKGNVTELVAGLSNVKTLHLSSHSLEVFHFCCKSMPVFQNLLTLSIESDKEKGWQVLPLLINNSPNLETLVIEGLVHQVTEKCGDACVCNPNKKKMEEEEECCLSTCQVKALHISGYGGSYRELMQMRHFLGNLKYLETVTVGVVEAESHREGDNVDDNYLTITGALMRLHRVSSKCQIHFF